MRLLVYFWSAFTGICLAATLAALSAGEWFGVVLSGSAFFVSVALGLYCYRGLDRP